MKASWNRRLNATSDVARTAWSYITRMVGIDSEIIEPNGCMVGRALLARCSRHKSCKETKSNSVMFLTDALFTGLEPAKCSECTSG